MTSHVTHGTGARLLILQTHSGVKNKTSFWKKSQEKRPEESSQGPGERLRKEGPRGVTGKEKRLKLTQRRGNWKD